MPKKLCFDRLWVLILFFAALFFLLSCAAAGQNSAAPRIVPPDPHILRVGVTPDAPPLIFKQNHKFVGLEADFARGLAEYLGKSPSFVELKWEDQIPALLENRIDIIMSGMTITTLRKVRIAFCIPYLRSGQMALIRREDAARFSTGLFTLTTSSAIGVIKNTFGEYFAEQSYSGVKKVTFSAPQSAVKALIDKRIDIFIYDGPMVLYLASENEVNGLTALFTPLTEEYLGWGVRKDNVELLESADKFLQTRNEEGTLNKMIKFWIPLAQ
jgi:ABC-type amino acid transport substrate-binding protein